MADEVVVIDVQAKFTDNTSSGVENAKRSVADFEDSVKDTEKTLSKMSKKKHSVKVAMDDKATSGIQKVLKNANKIHGKRFKGTLAFLDKASTSVSKVTKTARSFASKTWKSTLSVIDKATPIVQKAKSSVKSFVNKSWKTTLSVVDKFTSPLTKLKNMLFNINTLIATVATGLATKFVVADPIQQADTLTTSQIFFETKLGSTGAADKMLNNIKQFAVETPFETDDIISYTQSMLAMGFEADKVLDNLNTIGNTSAALGKGSEGIDSIVRALGQMQMKGKVSAEEMLQLTEAGVNGWGYIAKGIGKTTAQVQEMVSDGLIPVEDAIGYILKGMGEYDGMMQKTANKTVSGLASQIKDTFSIAIVEKWGKGLQRGAVAGLEGFNNFLGKIDDKLQSAGTSLEEFGETLSTKVFDVLGGVQERFEKVIDTDEFKNADLGEKIKIVWDEVIWEPFSDWWESKAKPKIAEKMSAFGESIGRGISSGILTLLGFDVSGSIDEGASIGASFAEGFTKGFDGEAVGEAILEALKSVFKKGNIGIADMLTPGDQGASASDKLAGVALAYGGIKLAGLVGGAYSFGKGAFNVGKKVIGGLTTVGDKLVPIGTATAKALGAKGATSALAAPSSAVGLGAIAGGVVGGVTVIKGGNDLYKSYKAFKSGDKTEGKARLASGGTAIGGVAAGAGIGASIGSVVPVIGTAAGALIGAGIGGIAGWLGGNKWGDSIREEAEAVRFESEQMQEAVKDSSVSAEQLAEKFQDAVNTNIAEHFGDVALSVEEIATLAKQIVFGDNIKSFETFSSAAETATASMENLYSATNTLNKWNWKASLGLELSDDDITGIQTAVENFISSSEQFIEDKHYEFTAAVSLLIDPKSEDGASVIKSGDAFYSSLQKELDTLGSNLSKTTKVALKDGIITLDEQAEINNLQSQIASITNKIAQAEAEAEFETLKIKFGSGNLDAESFAALQAEIQAQVDASTESYDQALTTSITSLKLQLSEDAITQDEYDSQLQTLMEGYNANIESLNAQVSDVQLEILGDAYSDILGDDAKANLSNALNESIKTGIDPVQWSAEETANLLGLSSISEESAAAINTFMSQVASSMATSVANTDMSAVGSTVTSSVGDSITNADKTPINSAVDGVRTSTDTAIQTAFSSPFTVTSSVDVTLDWNILNPTANIGLSGNGASGKTTTVTASVVRKAAGGYVDSKTLSWLAEEGTPEMVIPLGSHRRGRAVSLWKQTGEMLGITPQKNALGGIVGADSNSGSDGTMSYRFAGMGSFVINMGGITFQISTDGDSTDILAAVKAQKDAICEVLTEALYEALLKQFENMPLAI